MKRATAILFVILAIGVFSKPTFATIIFQDNFDLADSLNSWTDSNGQKTTWSVINGVLKSDNLNGGALGLYPIGLILSDTYEISFDFRITTSGGGA